MIPDSQAVSAFSGDIVCDVKRSICVVPEYKAGALGYCAVGWQILSFKPLAASAELISGAKCGRRPGHGSWWRCWELEGVELRVELAAPEV